LRKKLDLTLSFKELVNKQHLSLDENLEVRETFWPLQTKSMKIFNKKITQSLMIKTIITFSEDPLSLDIQTCIMVFECVTSKSKEMIPISSNPYNDLNFF